MDKSTRIPTESIHYSIAENSDIRFIEKVIYYVKWSYWGKRCILNFIYFVRKKIKCKYYFILGSKRKQPYKSSK